MISVEYCRTMARYNAWQNKSMRASIESLPAEELNKNRRAFFGSIFATANHLLWGDRIWLSRFVDGQRPPGSIKESVNLHDNLQLYLDDRLLTDEAILRWANKVNQINLAGDLTFFSGATGREVTKPMGVCVTHFFNHQTHHRGQIHAMLTAAGAKPDATDLFIMPEDA